MKSIIFDLDGTLLNTLPDLATALDRTLQQFNYPTHSHAVYKQIIGAGARDHVRRSLPQEKQHDEKHVDAVFAVYRKFYGELWHEQTELYPGIAEMLDALVSRNVVMSILTNKPQEFTDRVGERYFKKWPFVEICGAKVLFPHKPAPDQATNLAKKMNIAPSEIFFIGDSAIDILTAKNAGMIPVGVLWGFRERQELEESGAKIIIEHPHEILAL